jgi:predicted ArsR family transcriptional regulator
MSGMSVFSKGRIRLVVAAAIEQTAGQPFTLSDLASATGLGTHQIFSVLNRMLHAGLVRVAGEQHKPGKPGRGVRVYLASTDAAATAATPGCEDCDAALVERVRAVVGSFAERFDFTAADVASQSGVRRETVRWILARLEREGVVCPLVEIRPSEIPGRPAQRWTSNPENMATQVYLTKTLHEIESD